VFVVNIQFLNELLPFVWLPVSVCKNKSNIYSCRKLEKKMYIEFT